MDMHMPDSRLNRAERALQHPFRKSHIFNGLLMAAAVGSVYWPMHGLPDFRPRAPASVLLSVQPVELPDASAPLRLAGAWKLEAADPRFGGLSALAIDRGRFLAVTDLGAAIRFDVPTAVEPKAVLSDLREGPGPFGQKWARDAESLARDPGGQGWWVGYEQYHSLWLYDGRFGRVLAEIALDQPDWRDNRGAEGLLAEDGMLLVTAENGKDAIEVGTMFSSRVGLNAEASVADAARAPDGSAWLLLRSFGLGGINQSIAPLLKDGIGYRSGPAWTVPKAPFDNFEGMAIEALPDGRWRFWLVTDDGHRIMARTLLIALDYSPPKNDKSPAQRTGPSKKPAGKSP